MAVGNGGCNLATNIQNARILTKDMQFIFRLLDTPPI